MTQFPFDPGTYLENMRADIPVFDELQDEVAKATEGVAASEILELGVGGDQLRWLADAGFETRTTWSWKDLAVLQADLPG